MSDNTEKIRQLLDEMRSFHPDGDEEGQHSRADDLLLAALRLLADEGHYTQALREMCALWEALPKWFA